MKDRYVMARKWRTFGFEITEYFHDKIEGLFISNPNIIIPKHLSDRVMDRFSDLEHGVIRTMFYHLINYNLCEFLYWYKRKDYTSLDVVIENFRITFSRDGRNNIVARTIWNGNTAEETPGVMKIYLEKIKRGKNE